MNFKKPENMIRIDGILETKQVFIDGEELSPEPSRELYNHSPDGFNWGYGGSGPAQLALAILLWYLGNSDRGRRIALKLYQEFKSDFVAKLPQSNFTRKFSLENWIKRHE